MADDLPIVVFESESALRSWLIDNHAGSVGVWVRIFKRTAGRATVTFEELLAQGLCFGWSESSRRRFDESSYLQRFTPRRTTGTTSMRNVALAQRLIDEGMMTPAGRRALGINELET